MLRIVRKSRGSIRKGKLTEGQIRSVAKAATKIIAVTVAEEKSQVEDLLRRFQVPLKKKPSSKQLIEGIMDILAKQDARFIAEFEAIIVQIFPELERADGYDNFGQKPFQFGGGARITNGLSSSSLLDGAKDIGGSTVSGVATGGLAGGILGTIGGIFGFAKSAKDQNIAKQQASAQTFSSMLNYKSARNALKSEGARNVAKIFMASLAVIGLLIGVMIYSKNKKAKKWDDQLEAA